MPGFQGTPGGQPGIGGPSPINMPPFSPGQMPTPGMGLPGRPGFSPHGGPGMGTPGFDPSNGGLPRPPHMVGGPQNPNFVKAVKTTKVFIGSIAPGVTDAILTGLIHTCGPLYNLNRVTGTTGKPQAFGFAEFEDPEVVLRCLKCLNETELPDMTPAGRSSGATKKLIVRADEKTKAFLDEFEQLNIRTDHDDELDDHARKRIQTIVQAMKDPNADLNSIIPAAAAPNVSDSAKDNGPMVPDHLKDLDAEELPEDQRGVVLDQIASFRVQALKKEEERKRKDEMLNSRAGSSGSHNQGRPDQGGNQMRQWGGRNEQPGARPIGDGPQGYNQPVGFVKAQTVEGKQEDERTDEEIEQKRIQDQKRRIDEEYYALERRVEGRESRAMRTYEKEADDIKRQDAYERDARERARRFLKEYDDDKEEASGRDVFFADRGKWRSMRQSVRRREYQDDVKDRHAEEQEMAELEKQTEELLQKQMQEMADLEAKQRAAGYLFDDSAHIKVAIAGNTGSASAAAKQKTNISFTGDDDDEAGKKKRTLIMLDDAEGLSPAQRDQRNAEKLNAMRDALPTDRTALWAIKIKWGAAITSQMANKIEPFVRSTIAAALGMEEDDLSNAIIQQINEQSAPEGLLETLEPVLEEDAAQVVSSIWRQLAFETAAYTAGLTTGSMTI